jgi:hypothetical protein
MRLGIVLAMGLATCLAVPVASAGEPGTERAEYVERAEPICKANVLANKRIFKGAKDEVKEGKLKRASTHFFRAAAAFGRTIRQVTAIPQPPADQLKLGKWLDLLRDERALIEKIGRALAAGQRDKAESYSVDLNRNSNKANNAVLSFGFDYCRIEPSRFGSA